MAGQAQIEKVIRQEQKQDCGCGCGGILCRTARQEVIWVRSPKSVTARESNAEQCDCGCECCR